MNYTRKLTLLFIIIIVCQSFAFSQRSFTIKGQIMDGNRDEPLIAAAVSIKGKPVGTATDFDGKFSFQILEEHWKDTLVVSMLGYKAYKLPVLEAQQLPKNYLRIALEETAFELVMAEVEAPLMESVMAYTQGNQTKASIVLGLNRGTLRKKLKMYGLN